MFAISHSLDKTKLIPERIKMGPGKKKTPVEMLVEYDEAS